jgi:hypothetical protein
MQRMRATYREQGVRSRQPPRHPRSRWREAGGAVDTAPLLAEMAVPHPARPTWPDALRFAHTRLLTRDRPMSPANASRARRRGRSWYRRPSSWTGERSSCRGRSRARARRSGSVCSPPRRTRRRRRLSGCTPVVPAASTNSPTETGVAAGTVRGPGPFGVSDGTGSRPETIRFGPRGERGDDGSRCPAVWISAGARC